MKERIDFRSSTPNTSQHYLRYFYTMQLTKAICFQLKFSIKHSKHLSNCIPPSKMDASKVTPRRVFFLSLEAPILQAVFRPVRSKYTKMFLISFTITLTYEIASICEINHLHLNLMSPLFTKESLHKSSSPATSLRRILAHVLVPRSVILLTHDVNKKHLSKHSPSSSEFHRLITAVPLNSSF